MIMNAYEEVYFWVAGTLYSAREFEQLLRLGRVSPNDATTITFTPGTYTRVFGSNGRELLPTDGNQWLYGQTCPCGRFSSVGKRATTIRQHFMYCRARYSILGGHDPVSDLCALWSGLE